VNEIRKSQERERNMEQMMMLACSYFASMFGVNLVPQPQTAAV